MSYLQYGNEFLKHFTLFGNSAADYAVAVAVFLVVFAAAWISKKIILARLRTAAEQTTTGFDNAVIRALDKIHIVTFAALGLYLATRSLVLSDLITAVVNAVVAVAIAYEVIRALSRLVDFFVMRSLQKMGDTEDRPQRESMARMMSVLLKSALWIVGVLTVIANLGINITAFIASLGIGGIAIALAVQNILGDLFSSFTIYVDKPFKVGDFIIVGTDMGTVERIGMKSTRIRTLQGQELTISNNELTAARVQNFKRMDSRRVAFDLSIPFSTPPEKLEKIPLLIREIVEKQQPINFDRCHLRDIGAFAFVYETVFFINSPDYNLYMDIRQAVNLDICKAFAAEKIAFAYPTQTARIIPEP